jgi:hypothetical protein
MVQTCDGQGRCIVLVVCLGRLFVLEIANRNERGSSEN